MAGNKALSFGVRSVQDGTIVVTRTGPSPLPHRDLSLQCRAHALMSKEMITQGFSAVRITSHTGAAMESTLSLMTGID
jgi:hypothetical protein